MKAINGAQAAKIGTVTSPSGVRQVTDKGHPLYYYVGDSRPGSTRGQRLNEFGALVVRSESGRRRRHEQPRQGKVRVDDARARLRLLRSSDDVRPAAKTG